MSARSREATRSASRSSYRDESEREKENAWGKYSAHVSLYAMYIEKPGSEPTTAREMLHGRERERVRGDIKRLLRK